MFLLIFGLFWTTISTIILAVILVLSIFIQELELTDMFGGAILFLSMFEIIGIYLIIKGTKQVIANKKTDMHGYEIYGVILKTYETGAYVNNVPELKAEILAYLEYERIPKVFEEIIGLAPAKYDVGTYVILKHYENDVNIVKKVNKEEIPERILSKIEVNLENQ